MDPVQRAARARHATPRPLRPAPAPKEAQRMESPASAMKVARPGYSHVFRSSCHSRESYRILYFSLEVNVSAFVRRTGFYGDGVTCTPCTSCDSQATQTGSCPAGSTADGITCSCNAEYWGDGVSCTACVHPTVGPGSCGASATAYTCQAGSTWDTSACVCQAGYFGDGVQCTDCPEVLRESPRDVSNSEFYDFRDHFRALLCSIFTVFAT
jgi:hypothetical protein